jgi:hypothetical protein
MAAPRQAAAGAATLAEGSGSSAAGAAPAQQLQSARTASLEAQLPWCGGAADLAGPGPSVAARAASMPITCPGGLRDAKAQQAPLSPVATALKSFGRLLFARSSGRAGQAPGSPRSGLLSTSSPCLGARSQLSQQRAAAAEAAAVAAAAEPVRARAPPAAAPVLTHPPDGCTSAHSPPAAALLAASAVPAGSWGGRAQSGLGRGSLPAWPGAAGGSLQQQQQQPSMAIGITAARAAAVAASPSAERRPAGHLSVSFSGSSTVMALQRASSGGSSVGSGVLLLSPPGRPKVARNWSADLQRWQEACKRHAQASRAGDALSPRGASARLADVCRPLPSDAASSALFS